MRKLAVAILLVMLLNGLVPNQQSPTAEPVVGKAEVPAELPAVSQEVIERRAQEPVSRASTVKREEIIERNDDRYTLRVQVTAYTLSPDETSGTGLAYDGRKAIPYHTLAVDPRVIPLGSRVYIPGLGWFFAHDTGSAIIGHIIDVCLETKKEAKNWGRRTLEVVVIPPKDKFKMAW